MLPPPEPVFINSRYRASRRRSRRQQLPVAGARPGTYYNCCASSVTSVGFAFLCLSSSGAPLRALRSIVKNRDTPATKGTRAHSGQIEKFSVIDGTHIWRKRHNDKSEPTRICPFLRCRQRPTHCFVFLKNIAFYCLVVAVIKIKRKESPQEITTCQHVSRSSFQFFA